MAKRNRPTVTDVNYCGKALFYDWEMCGDLTASEWFRDHGFDADDDDILTAHDVKHELIEQARVLAGIRRSMSA
jgi:hypothetical protein